MKFNTEQFDAVTHEGWVAKSMKPEEELLKLCLTSFLEKSFYQTAEETIERLVWYLEKVNKDFVLKVAIFSRIYWLRSINHFIVAWYVKNYSGNLSRSKLSSALKKMIRRPDELWEILWALKFINKWKFVFPNSLKFAFWEVIQKFDEYQMDKYKNKWDIKLYDIINLWHYKGEFIDKLMKWQLKKAERWENKLSAWEDKKSSFTSLLSEWKLGTTAMLMNMRNMLEAWVDESLIVKNLESANMKGIFPFQVLRAIWFCRYSSMSNKLLSALEEVAMKWFDNLPIEWKTAVLVDTSWSMTWGTISWKSELRPIDVASFYWALAEKKWGICYAWATDCKRPNIFAWDSVNRISEAIQKTDVWCGTDLQQAIDKVKDYDNVIVFSDMQCSYYVNNTWSIKNIYLFDLTGYENSIAVKWNMYNISGFSDIMFRLSKDLKYTSNLIEQINTISI